MLVSATVTRASEGLTAGAAAPPGMPGIAGAGAAPGAVGMGSRPGTRRHCGRGGLGRGRGAASRIQFQYDIDALFSLRRIHIEVNALLLQEINHLLNGGFMKIELGNDDAP